MSILCILFIHIKKRLSRYSALIAINGSTRTARIAGNMQPTTVIAADNAAALKNVVRSPG